MRVRPLLVALLVVTGCGAAEERTAREGGRVVAGRGLELSLPEGWHGDVTKLGPHHATTLRAATFPLGPLTDIGHSDQERMGPDDLLVVVADYGPRPASPAAKLPLRLGEEHVVAFEGFRRPVATTSAKVAGTALQVWVVAAAAPTPAQLDRANAVLATLRVESAARAVPFADAEVGVSGEHPVGWHRERALTGLVEPREVLALASYPLRRGAEAGECAPDTAREDMPRGGAFVWLLEYRSGVPIERFPERPRPFRLDRGSLDEDVSCFAGPGLSATFRDADRRFQLLVAFGGPPAEERLREVEAILDALVLERVPTPPPPPWADWPLLPTSTPDSMHAPPGWPAAGAEFDSEADPPPRALFFAANRPLPLLPQRLVDRARLPGHFPDLVLAHGFPDDAVLLWVLEESSRRPLAREFPPIDRDWPGRADFRPVEIATKPAPHVRWLVASGEWMGHRFSVWIARGPTASADDLDLALTAARTVAVSGCDRGVGPRCAEPRSSG